MSFPYPSLVTLSPLPFPPPLSFQSVFSFSIKCFYSQFTGSKVLLNLSSVFSPRLSSSSRAPLYTRCTHVPIYASSFVCFFLSISSPVFTASVFFFLSRSPFLPSPSAPVSIFSPFPCRAHNCITERPFSQLTLSSLHPHSSRYVRVYRSRNRIVLFVHIHSEREQRRR